MEERRGAYGVFFGYPEGKSPPGRPKYKWENIKMHLKRDRLEVRGIGMIWLKGSGHL
jgi:hypothetical protein